MHHEGRDSSSLDIGRIWPLSIAIPCVPIRVWMKGFTAVPDAVPGSAAVLLKEAESFLHCTCIWGQWQVSNPGPGSCAGPTLTTASGTDRRRARRFGQHAVQGAYLVEPLPGPLRPNRSAETSLLKELSCDMMSLDSAKGGMSATMLEGFAVRPACTTGSQRPSRPIQGWKGTD